MGISSQNLASPDGFTRLSSGFFLWLVNIQPGYVVFRQGNSCMVEPYMPCRFARQFGYDQLYVGNPNPNLNFCENLFEGARAWYYSIAGRTGAVFTLSHKTPNSYASLDFCTWYFMANKVPGFGINTSCIKGIKSTYKAKVGSKSCQMRPSIKRLRRKQKMRPRGSPAE